MSAAEHVLAILFATPAGVLAYITLTQSNHPEVDLRHFLAVILLFILPLIGLPQIAGSTVIYFLVGIALAAYGPRLTGQGRPTPTSQDDRVEPQGPQPPRKAVQVDREYAYDYSVIVEFDDGYIDGFDFDRVQRMRNALTDDEMTQLKLFWQWRKETGQIQGLDAPPSVIDHVDDTGDEIRIWTDQ